MAVIQIENFGGEFPRVPARKLTQGGASINANLLATSADFRPLMGASDVTVAANGAVTLYRKQLDASGALLADITAGWISSVDDINYVRGQVAEDATERTYLSYNSGTQAPRVINNLGADYPLGVPAPAKPQLSLLTTEKFTYAKANEWLNQTLVPAVVQMIANNTSEDQFSSRFVGPSGEKMLTGTIYGSSIAGVTRFDPQQYIGASPGVYEYFPKGLPESDPKSQRGLYEPWNIMMRVPAMFVTPEGMGNPQLGGVFAYDPLDNTTPIWIGIAGLPLWGVVNTAGLKTAMSGFKNPSNPTEALWDAAQLTTFSNELAALMSPNNAKVLQLRHRLDGAVSDFAMAGYTSIQAATRPAEPTDTTASDFVTRKAAFDKALSEWKTKHAAAVARMVAAQKLASEISQEIEALYVTTLKSNIRTVVADYFAGKRLERTDQDADGLVVLDSEDAVEPRLYVTTFVTALGDESAPSPVSDMVEVGPNDLVSIKQPAVPRADITQWRIYRSNGSLTEKKFQLDAELSIGATVPAPLASPDIGSTNAVVPGLETSNKWRDIVANWQISFNHRGLIGTSIDVYTDTSLLRVGDRATQSDWRQGQTYSVTKTWNGGAWVMQRVPDISGLVGTLAHIDGRLSEDLGEELVTTTWMEPPSNIKGFVNLSNGVMAGFFGNTVAFCEPYVPYAWPVEYQIALAYPVVGLCAFGNSVLVGTRGVPYIISGTDSASMAEQNLDVKQPCVSRRSMVAAEGGVFYASPDGYCFASQAGVEIATAGLFSNEDWQKLAPESIFAVVHDGVLYFWYTGNGGGCYGLDMVARKLTRHDIPATAVFDDVVTDAAYVADNGKVKRLFSPSGARATGQWKSGLMGMPAQVPFAWGKVVSDFEAGPVTLQWSADGALRHTKVVASIEPFKLPPGRYLEHQLDVQSKSRVTAVMLASTTEELKAL